MTCANWTKSRAWTRIQTTFMIVNVAPEFAVPELVVIQSFFCEYSPVVTLVDERVRAALRDPIENFRFLTQTSESKPRIFAFWVPASGQERAQPAERAVGPLGNQPPPARLVNVPGTGTPENQVQ